MFHLVLWLAIVLGVNALASQRAIELTDLSLQSPDKIIHITNSDYSLLFDRSQEVRDYWTFLILTTTDKKHGCLPCTKLQDVFQTVANSWFHDYSNTHSLFFAVVDLIDASNMGIFQELNLETAPHIWLIPPEKNKSEVQTASLKHLPRFIYKAPLDDSHGQALQMAQFLSENVQKSIIVREGNQLLSFLKTFGITLGSIILFKKRGPKFVKNLRKKNAYEVITMILLLSFICGYSFTMIQGTPFIAKNDKNEPIYISGGQFYQFGIEVVIVGSNYLALAASLVSLIYIGNYNVNEKSKVPSEKLKFWLIFANATITYLLYSSLTSLFLRKNHDYPYYLSKLF